MVTYAQQLARLSPLETFDPAVFVGDDKTPQHVCDFVLSLAVAYNDIRDLVHAQQLLAAVRPADLTQPSTAAGQFGGLHVHWVRMLAGVLTELAQLITENSTVLASASFQGVIRSLPKSFREAWQSTVTAASATTPQGDRFGRLIYFARNKVAFHYDRKEISRGYGGIFLRADSQPPFISRGNNMAETRFFFADAAVEAYMMQRAQASNGLEFFESGWKILPDIGHALREIVVRFINRRSAWRSPATQPNSTLPLGRSE